MFVEHDEHGFAGRPLSRDSAGLCRSAVGCGQSLGKSRVFACCDEEESAGEEAMSQPRRGKPEVLVRSVVATREDVHAFGEQLAAAAWQRGSPLRRGRRLSAMARRRIGRCGVATFPLHADLGFHSRDLLCICGRRSGTSSARERQLSPVAQWTWSGYSQLRPLNLFAAWHGALLKMTAEMDGLRIAESAPSRPVFQHHAGHGQRGGVGDGKRGAGCAEAGCNLRGASVKAKSGP